MSPLVIMMFTLIAAYLQQCGDCLETCSGNLSKTQMLRGANEKCPAGYYKKHDCLGRTHIVCERCDQEQYTAYENKLLYCKPCIRCDKKENKVTKSECTPEKDRVCVCKEGFYELKIGGFMVCKKRNCKNCTIL